GPVLSNVNVKIAEDGEVYVKGPNVMLGYYKQPELTLEVIDAEGWFHTGDIGMMDEGKFLKITDRKKEMFKTSGGKYITPQSIESRLKESRFIEQVMIIGENEKFPAALIVPAFGFVKQWCDKRNIPYSTNEDIVKHPDVNRRIMEEVELVNNELAQYEKVKKIELLAHEWTIDRGEMTPKLSLKRNVILSENKAAYDKIYQHVI
ncbi:MAG: long-chain fatty acid--CoA ligase, partial [Bacteroidia bacterium]